MSVHVSSWVWRESDTRGLDLLVLLALADQANDSGQCWPSQKALVERTKLSRATVQRRLVALRDRGIIYVIEREGSSNIYGFSHLRDAAAPQENPKSEGVPHTEAPHGRGRGASRERQGCLTAEAQNRQEPLLNRQSARKRASQFPEGFTYSDVREWSITNKLPVGSDDFEQFKDHHLARGSKFVDWQRAWQTWARNAKKWDRSSRSDDRDAFGGAMYGVFK